MHAGSMVRRSTTTVGKPALDLTRSPADVTASTGLHLAQGRFRGGGRTRVKLSRTAGDATTSLTSTRRLKRSGSAIAVCGGGNVIGFDRSA
jgi:hypothetical protein